MQTVLFLCHEAGLHQIDLLNGSANRVTEREYWAKKLIARLFREHLKIKRDSNGQKLNEATMIEFGTIPKMKTERFGGQPGRPVFPVWVLTGFACYSASKSRLTHAIFRKCTYTCCACCSLKSYSPRSFPLR